jgi:hypothetical protein
MTVVEEVRPAPVTRPPAPGGDLDRELTEDPVDALVARVGPGLGRPVDPYQVTAVLEADGITDRGARVEYGYVDVFALAARVFALVRPVPATPGGTAGDPRAGHGARDAAHGLLYLVPAALFPAALAAAGRHALLPALVTASALGWVWSSAGAWLAWRLLGRGLVRSAGRVLAATAVAGLPVAAAAGAVVGFTTHGGTGPVALAAGQMAYQMAAAVAMFYRREGVLLAAMAPGTAAGLAYLATGRPAPGVVVAATAVSLLAALVLALRRTTEPSHPMLTGDPADPPRHPWRAELPGLLPVLGYAALSAAFLLTADARFLHDRLDLALAATPLIAGMGLVEWRARRFQEQARTLLRRVRYPREFVAGVWLRLLAGLAASVGLLAALAGAAALGLRQAHLLGTASAVLAAAHVLVGGAYYLAFVLTGHDRFGPAAGALALALLARLVAAPLAGPGALAQATVFLASCVLLQALLAAALGPVLGQAWRYQ